MSIQQRAEQKVKGFRILFNGAIKETILGKIFKKEETKQTVTEDDGFAVGEEVCIFVVNSHKLGHIRKKTKINEIYRYSILAEDGCTYNLPESDVYPIVEDWM